VLCLRLRVYNTWNADSGKRELHIPGFGAELAELYQVENKQMTRAVRRNIDRFPDDFMFELTGKEFEDLRCQFGTSDWESVRYAPMAFAKQKNRKPVGYKYI